MWTYLTIGCGFAFAAAVQPGPFQTYVISETLRRGVRRALPAAFAPLISDAPIVAVCLLAVSRIPPSFLRGVRLAGAAFLFTLAWGAYRNWRHPSPDASGDAGPGTLLKAALVNFLNPNPWLGWSLVMGPLLLKGWAESPSHGAALIVGFYLTMVACQVGLIVLVSSARSLDAGVARGGQAAAVVALAAFAVYQLWLGLSAGG